MFGLETLLAMIHHAATTFSNRGRWRRCAWLGGRRRGLDEELDFLKGGTRCVTTCPPFMYSNTANSFPFSDGPFIVASTRSPVKCVKTNRRPGSKREDCMLSWCKKG